MLKGGSFGSAGPSGGPRFPTDRMLLSYKPGFVTVAAVVAARQAAAETCARGRARRAARRSKTNRQREDPPGPAPIERTTALLRTASAGDREALDALLPLVYDELRRIAHIHLRTEREDHTLNTTGLVHEAYLKLVDQTQVEWRERTRFFAIASMAMRRILVDYARRHRTQKRGGGWTRVALTSGSLPVESRAEMLIELDQALTRLAEVDERLCRVVEHRFFAGMTEAETAEALGVSARTVRSDWATAKGLLYQELTPP
jgi:RNA polymerase sigma factor (TIGR02999 family)